ncbi:MAG TPA: methyltransferase domain-containing protein [bacterium]|nr:methyltransferase domain-containing protein [bacterium]
MRVFSVVLLTLMASTSTFSAPDSIISAGPYVHFDANGTVSVLWKTAQPADSTVEFGTTRDLGTKAADSQLTLDHQIPLPELLPETEYYFRIRSRAGDTESVSDIEPFDSTFERVPSIPWEERRPYENDFISATCADKILQETGIRNGYCLVLGFGEGRLAYELAARSNLRIIGIDDDPKAVATARNLFKDTGIYGSRISVHEGNLDSLPYSDYFANLIVSEKMLTTGEICGSASEIMRLLRPDGGTAWLGTPSATGKTLTPAALKNWAEQGAIQNYSIQEQDGLWLTFQRPALNGAGEWTHMYAEPGNTACSKDTRIEQPTEILWFGGPGPRLMVDRHHRPMSSLFKHGRSFIPADNRVIAMESYNGARLWDLDVPRSRRIGIMRDWGQMFVTDEYLYIAAKDQCTAVEVATGKPSLFFIMPQLIEGERRLWGYVAGVDNQIFGSGKKETASLYEMAKDTVNDLIENDFRPGITSDYLFSLDRFSGKNLWTYKNGVILNSCLAIGDGHLHFVENRGSAARSDTDGRMSIQEFCAGETYLVALNLKTGEKVWEKRFEFPFEQIMYLSFADHVLLSVGSFNVGNHVHYGLFTFDAKTGELKWNQKYDSGDGIGGSHGEQWQHPVIIGNMIYSKPYAYNLHTGEKNSFYLDRGGNGCGTISGCNAYLFARGRNPRIYPAGNERTSGEPLTNITRPGCFINIIPAGGMVLIPESSSGCTCAFSLQTSLALISKNRPMN